MNQQATSARVSERERNVTKRATRKKLFIPFSMTGAFQISMNSGLLADKIHNNHDANDNDDDVNPLTIK